MIKKKNEKIKKMYEQNIRKIFKKKACGSNYFFKKRNWVGGWGANEKNTPFLHQKNMV